MNDLIKKEDYLELRSKIDQALQESRKIIVLSEDQLDPAGFYLKHFRQLSKAIEDTKKKYTKPLKDEAKQIESVFRELTEMFAAEEKRLANELQDFLNEKKQAEAEQRAKEQKEYEDAVLEEAEMFSDTSVIDSMNDVKIETKSEKLGSISQFVTETRTKKWRLIDLDKVDRKYLILDEKLIDAVRKDHDFDSKSPIDGIEFYTEFTIKTK